MEIWFLLSSEPKIGDANQLDLSCLHFLPVFTSAAPQPLVPWSLTGYRAC